MTTQSKPERVLAKPGKYMIFTLSGELYGISISLIQEVIEQLPITKIPNTPSFILGVINLRGRIIPVLDLRVKLRMNIINLGNEACILILKIPIREDTFNMGIQVEEVYDISDISADKISMPPHFGVKINTKYLDGVVKEEGKPPILLINAINALTSKETAEVQQLVEEEIGAGDGKEKEIESGKEHSEEKK